MVVRGLSNLLQDHGHVLYSTVPTLNGFVSSTFLLHAIYIHWHIAMIPPSILIPHYALAPKWDPFHQYNPGEMYGERGEETPALLWQMAIRYIYIARENCWQRKCSL